MNEIKNRKHNLWIGVSFGNRFFTPENISNLINLGLQLTKDKLLIWIPGRLQAINYRYLEDLSRAKSLKKAFAEEEKYRQEIIAIVAKLPVEDQNKIVLANYDDLCTPKYIHQRETLYKEFSSEGLFYDEVIDVVRDILKARNRTENKDRLESLALYVVQELPAFLDGVRTTHEDTHYAAILYPGLGKLDHLVEAIKTSSKYPELRERLKLENISGIVDVS